MRVMVVLVVVRVVGFVGREGEGERGRWREEGGMLTFRNKVQSLNVIAAKNFEDSKSASNTPSVSNCNCSVRNRSSSGFLYRKFISSSCSLFVSSSSAERSLYKGRPRI